MLIRTLHPQVSFLPSMRMVRAILRRHKVGRPWSVVLAIARHIRADQPISYANAGGQLVAVIRYSAKFHMSLHANQTGQQFLYITLPGGCKCDLA